MYSQIESVSPFGSHTLHPSPEARALLGVSGCTSFLPREVWCTCMTLSRGQSRGDGQVVSFAGVVCGAGVSARLQYGVKCHVAARTSCWVCLSSVCPVPTLGSDDDRN